MLVCRTNRQSLSSCARRTAEGGCSHIFRDLLRQGHGHRLIVGPDDYAQGFALVEYVQRYGKGDDDGAGRDFTGMDLGFRWKGRLGAVLERGERLKISIKIHGGNGVGGGVSARPLEGAFKGV